MRWRSAWGTVIQAGKFWVRHPTIIWILSVYLIFPVALGPRVYSVITRDANKRISGGRARPAREADNPHPHNFGAIV
jgi:hypothetical protein